MKAIILFICSISFLNSCKSEADVENSTNIDKSANETASTSIEEMARRHVMATLNIPATEKIGLEVYKAHLDADGTEDAIITLNRKAKAIDDAAASGNTPRIVETGYMGNYNMVVHYNGAKNKFSQPIPIGSSAILPLKVEFQNIQSEFFKDAIVEYRIMDSAFSNYFFVQNGLIQLVLQHPKYVDFTSDNPEFYQAEFKQGSSNFSKDIFVYNALTKNNTSCRQIFRL